MVKVKNIKFTELPFETDDKNLQKCISLIKTINADYKKFIPKNPKQKLSFELTESQPELANCIRRYLMDEMEVYSMDVNEEKIKSTDKFILNDFIKKNIELIPFKQDIDTDIQLKLHVENKTDEIITIYSKDLEILYKNKPAKIEDYVTTTIPITQLRPCSTIDITDIKIVSGTGKVDAGKFALLSNIYYEIMDVEPLEENKFKRVGESSLVSNPTHFKLILTSHRNLDLRKIMPLCCANIIKKLEDIKTELTKIDEKEKIYLSDMIELETKGDIKLFNLKGEYWTISNIIAKYCYIIFNDIQFVCSAILHPSIETSVVKIKHPESVKIMIDAIKLIIADVGSIKKSF